MSFQPCPQCPSTNCETNELCEREQQRLAHPKPPEFPHVESTTLRRFLELDMTGIHATPETGYTISLFAAHDCAETTGYALAQALLDDRDGYMPARPQELYRMSQSLLDARSAIASQDMRGLQAALRLFWRERT